MRKRPEPHVSIVIPAWNGAGSLPDCLNAVFSSEYPSIDVIVVDNASSDGTQALLAEKFPRATVVHNHKNVGPGGALNQGNSLAKGDYVAWINQDAILDPEWITDLVRTFENNPRLGMASSIVAYREPENTIWSAGGCVDGITGQAWDFAKGEMAAGASPLAQPDYVAGCASIIRRRALDMVGGVDPGYFLYFEDADLGLRLKAAGFELAILAGPPVLHLGSHRPGSPTDAGNKLYFFVRSNIRFVVKNWPFPRMMIALGVSLGFYLLFATIKGPSTYFSPVVKAISWNLQNMENTVRQRVSSSRRLVPPSRLRSWSSFLYRMARKPELFPY